MAQPITSTSNPRVKSVAALANARERRITGLCTIEGHDEIALAFEFGARLETVFFCPDMMRTGDLVLLQKLESSRIEMIETTESVLGKMAYREHPDAWLAVAHAPESGFDSLEQRLTTHPLIIVLEGIEKPGNIGAVLRSVDAAGAAGIIACDCRTDIGNPNVIRASKGTVFALPVVECASDDAFAWLERHGIPLYAASPEGKTDFWSLDLRQPAAVAFGAEREGLTDAWFQRCRDRVTIPMRGCVNSLNIAQAATLVAYESLRQRTPVKPEPSVGQGGS